MVLYHLTEETKEKGKKKGGRGKRIERNGKEVEPVG